MSEVLVRIVLWSLFDSETTIDELQLRLPEVEAPSTWVWSEASERFGLVSFDDDPPEPLLARAIELIGAEPDVYEEFDAL